MLLSSGDYLSGRVTLTDVTRVSTTATLKFDNLECEDEKDYICTFIYVNEFGVVVIDESEPTSIIVNAYPSMPHNISSFIVSTRRTRQQENNVSNFLLERNTLLLSIKQNCSPSYWSRTNDPRNLIYLHILQSTTTQSTFFREWDTVIFSCKGNIGKPPGRLIWQKTSPQLERPIIYSNETTDVEQIPDGCSFRGTSNLTVLISINDLNAQFRCFEESQDNIPEMYVETAPLDVHCEYHLNFRFQNQVIGRAFAEVRNLLASQYIYMKEVGVYVCEAYNTIDGIDYKANNSVEIEIEHAAYEIPAICVVVITMICFAVRKSHRKREKGKISSCLDASVIYSEVDEHTKLKYRLKNNQATSSNPEPADVENDLIEGANEVFDILAVNISINQNITGLVGKNDTHLTCSFINDNKIHFINAAIIARNKNGTFPKNEPVAVFPRDNVGMLPPSGDYLSGRVTLTNITKLSTTATLRFDILQCEDEKDYICIAYYFNEFGVVITVESEPTRVLVKDTPARLSAKLAVNRLEIFKLAGVQFIKSSWTLIKVRLKKNPAGISGKNMDSIKFSWTLQSPAEL
ncbi:unnamed protein product [Mytilus coruscus]|uniref:CD80-like immunoglobulin C2-set domain-containing protein n=1 Tax=Mytilus coruscus TaxID=42192 RepID=A0A6J8BPY8_MYTCO|nr:unnamed protein product [Mytilus coruscus]